MIFATDSKVIYMDGDVGVVLNELYATVKELKEKVITAGGSEESIKEAIMSMVTLGLMSDKERNEQLKKKLTEQLEQLEQLEKGEDEE